MAVNLKAKVFNKVSFNPGIEQEQSDMAQCVDAVASSNGAVVAFM